jgi:hypothetical protein
MPHPSYIRQCLYESLPFIERMAMDKREIEAQRKREAEIAASNRTDDVARAVRLGFSECFMEMVNEFKEKERNTPRPIGSGPTSGLGAVTPVVLKVQPNWKLSDAEVEILRTCWPKRKHDKVFGNKDRAFIDACIWYGEAVSQNLTFVHMPPELGNVKTLKTRMRDWDIAGVFDTLYNRLLEAQGLSPERMTQFRGMADRGINYARAYRERLANKSAK